jgi:two-component system heavy metal sensor histidine kinase CusS
MSYLTKFTRTLWSIILFAAVITIMAARFAIHKGHSPLRKLTHKIESISADQLDSRLNPLDVPVELSVLVQSFNTMLHRLEDGFERLSYFSADIAHELRTPITNLTTQTQVMLSKPRSNEEYKDILYSNLEEYDRMTKMVSDMLLLAQTEHGLIKPNKDVVAVNKEIKELLEYFELLADERNIKLVMKGPTIEIFCDKIMLRQALSNLISNAIRHSPNDDEVIVQTQSSQGSITIAISNHGEPVSKEHINRLFDRFYRTDPSRKRDSQGAGLGLTIARSVIKVNGGDIIAESSNQTTRFTIVFDG